MLSVRRSSKVLKHKVDMISPYIVTSQLTAVLQLQNLTSHRLTFILESYFDSIVVNGRYYGIHEAITTVFTPLLSHYIKNGTLSSFSNKLFVYIAYMFCQIQSCDIRLKKQHHEFLKQFGESTYLGSVRWMYYDKLVSLHCPHTYYIHKNICTVSMLHEISKHVVTIPTLCILFGIKILDLSKARLASCCELCYNYDLTQFVIYKYNRPDDEFISWNYKEIKTFLRIHHPRTYSFICECEHRIINRMITYINPFTGKRLRLSTRKSNKFMYWLMFETQHSSRHSMTYHSLYNYILRRQKTLLHQFFDYV